MVKNKKFLKFSKGQSFKILFFLFITVLILNVWFNVKSAFSLDLWLESKNWFTVKEFLVYDNFIYQVGKTISTPVTKLFGKFFVEFPYGVTDLYFKARHFIPWYTHLIKSPWILTKFNLKVFGGQSIDIPEPIYLTSAKFAHSYTPGAGFSSVYNIPTVYLHGWCPGICYTLGSIIDSTASFEGWEPIPPGVFISYLLIGNVRGFLYNTANNPIWTFSPSYPYERSGFLILTDYLKSIFLAGGGSTVGGAAYFFVPKAEIVQDLEISLENKKIYEYPNKILGERNFDLTNYLKNFLIKQTKEERSGIVKLPLGVSTKDSQDNFRPITSTVIDFEAMVVTDNFKMELPKKRINLKISDSETKEVLVSVSEAKDSLEVPISPLSGKVNLEIFDYDTNTKLSIKNKDLYFLPSKCNFEGQKQILTPTSKKIKILLDKECLSDEMEIEFDITDLKIRPETLRIKRCEKNVCENLRPEIKDFGKKAKVITSGLSDFIIEKDDLKSLCPNPIKSSLLRKGNKGNDVLTLQKFLSQYPEFYPEGLITGYFGSLTERAVKRFQEKYKEEILAPLRLTSPTGVVGKRTKNKIENILCK